MNLFGKKKTTTAPAPSYVAPVVSAPVDNAPGYPTTGLSLAKGTISLQKGEAISLVKTSVITATVSWPDKTDYDVYALVRYRDGSVATVSQFGTKDHPHTFTPRTKDGAVIHLGDIQRGSGSMADESIEIRLTPDIVAVVPVCYSAQSNGAGSFRRYKVSMTVDNGAGDRVVIDASNASDNDHVYTCVPGIIINGDTVTVKRLEQYSRPNSEHRPTVDGNLVVHMDQGPVNAYK